MPNSIFGCDKPLSSKANKYISHLHSFRTHKALLRKPIFICFLKEQQSRIWRNKLATHTYATDVLFGLNINLIIRMRIL